MKDESKKNTVADKKVKKKRKKLYEFDALHDVKYLGPLSYRHLRIFAWLFFIVSQIGFVLSVYSKLDPVWGGEHENLIDGLSLLGGLTFPLFLLAAFAVILNV